MASEDLNVQSRLYSLMDEAWPDGVPPAEHALARSLASDRVSIAAARLDAVLVEERGGDLSAAAESLGMDRTAFFRLRKKWKLARSIRSITPYLGRAPRRVGVGAEEAIRIAADLIDNAGQNPDLAALALKLRDSVGLDISHQLATRLIREEAARTSAQFSNMTSFLGSRILVDFSGTAMKVISGASIHPAVCCFVVERNSRFILGSAAATLAQAGQIFVTAQQRAIDRFADLGGAGASPGELRIVLPDPSESFPEQVHSRIASDKEVTILRNGDRRFGTGLVELIGHRIDRVSLHPRTFLKSKTPLNGIGPSGPMRMKDAAAAIEEAVEHHNLARCWEFIKAIGAEDEETASVLVRDTQGQDARTAYRIILRSVPAWRVGVDRLSATLAKMEALSASSYGPLLDASMEQKN